MKFVIEFCILISLLAECVVSKEIAVCSDENYWYPFSYVNDSGKAEGIHVDMLEYILEKLEYDYSITPLPWKRCLLETRDGKYDAVLSASYKSERAEYLEYPANASEDASAVYLTKVEYVVVTHRENTYRYNGDVLTLPQPVRGVLGYSIVDDLLSQGVEVYKGFNVRDNIDLLIRSKRGAVITTPNTAKAIIDEFGLGKSLVVNETMLASKAYYLPFSILKKSVTSEMRRAIWKECEKLRNETRFMDSLYLKYERKVEDFLDTKPK